MNIRSLTGADQTNDLSNSLTVKSDTSVKDTVDIRNSDEPAKQKKKWTVMLYSAGDNNLKTFLYQYANELEIGRAHV